MTEKTLNFMEAMAEARKGAVIKRCGGYDDLVWNDGVLVVATNDCISIAVTETLLDSQFTIVTPAQKSKVKVAPYWRKSPANLRWALTDTGYENDAAAREAIPDSELRRETRLEIEVDE